jgi:hypothetical protein
MILVVRHSTKAGVPMFAVHRDDCRDLAREKRLHDATFIAFLWDGLVASISEAVRERVYPGDNEVSIRPSDIQIFPCA